MPASLAKRPAADIATVPGEARTIGANVVRRVSAAANDTLAIRSAAAGDTNVASVAAAITIADSAIGAATVVASVANENGTDAAAVAGSRHAVVRPNQRNRKCDAANVTVAKRSRTAVHHYAADQAAVAGSTDQRADQTAAADAKRRYADDAFRQSDGRTAANQS